MIVARLRTLLTILPLCVPLVANAQAPVQPNTMGPPLAGICLFARDSTVAGSKAGQATDARLRQLGAQVQAELAPQQAAIVAENNALNAAAANAPGRDARIDALQKRATAFNQLQQLRTAQLQQTRAQAIDAILQAMSPFLAPVASARRCSVVFERTATYGFAQAMDLTPEVIHQLDLKMPTMTFNLAPPESVKR